MKFQSTNNDLEDIIGIPKPQSQLDTNTKQNLESTSLTNPNSKPTYFLHDLSPSTQINNMDSNKPNEGRRSNPSNQRANPETQRQTMVNILLFYKSFKAKL